MSFTSLLRWFLGLILLGSTLSAIAQNSMAKSDSIKDIYKPIPNGILDSIHYFEEIDSFDRRYAIIKDYEKELIDNGHYEDLMSTNNLYNIHPKSAKDSIRYRYYLMHHAVKLKNYTGDYNVSLQFYLKAHSMVSDQVLLDKYAKYIELHIGNIYARINDYDKALIYLKSVIPNYKHFGDYKRLSRLYLSIGDNYRWLHKYELMKEYYDLAIDLGTKVDEPRAVQAASVNYASYLLSQDLEKKNQEGLIKEYLLRSINALEGYNRNDLNLRKARIYQTWASYYISKDSFPLALDKYYKVLAIEKQFVKSKRSRELAKSYKMIADVLLEMDKINEARLNLDTAFVMLIPDLKLGTLPSIDQVYEENTFTDLFGLMATYYLYKYAQENDQDLLDSCTMVIDLAFKANDQLESKLILRDSKLVSSIQNNSLLSKALYAISLKLNNQYDDQDLRSLFDRSKSRLLFQNIKKGKLLSSLDLSDKKRILDLENELIELNKSNEERNVKEEYNIRKSIDQLVPKDYVGLKSVTYITDPYIEYVYTDKAIFIYTNIGKRRFYPIKNRERVDNLLLTVFKSINTKENDELENALAELYSLLIPIDLSNLKSITFITDGKLDFLPFDILKKDDKYLLEELAIKYQKTALHIPGEKPEYKKDFSLLCLNPSYTESNTFMKSDLAERGTVNRLQYVASEIEMLENLFAENIELYNYLSYSQLNKKMKEASIFHFAGHALSKNDSSFLIQINQGVEEYVSRNEIEEMSNQLDLVTLSACQTGLGKTYKGEGLMSLATSFLSGGAKSVVYSLWSVNDKSTTEIMKLFYKNLSLGMAKDQALRNAKLGYLKAATPDARHPYYWAAFNIVGDCSPRVSSNFTYLKWLGILFLSLFIWILLKKSSFLKS